MCVKMNMTHSDFYQITDPVIALFEDSTSNIIGSTKMAAHIRIRSKLEVGDMLQVSCLQQYSTSSSEKKRTSK